MTDWYKIKRVLIWQNNQEKQIYPAYIEYDFTKSDWWWTATSWTSRDSSWFYRSWTYTDGWIYAPSSMFNVIPNKLILTYNKMWASCWTWFVDNTLDIAILSPWDPSYLNQVWYKENGSYPNKINLWGNPTWQLEWEITIDKSTTPRTLNHKIWTYSFSDTSWYIERMWNDKEFVLRVVNWQYNNWMHLQKFKVVF